MMDWYHIFPDKSFRPISAIPGQDNKIEFGAGMLAQAIRCGLPLENSSGISRRRVGEINIKNGIRISTVFLGLDHSYGKRMDTFTEKPSKECNPLIWECMVFGGCMDQECFRTTGLYRHAKRMHVKVLKRVLHKEFDLHIKDPKILGVVFDVGFALKCETPKIKKMPKTKDTEEPRYDLYEHAAIDKECEAMNAFMNENEKALVNIMYQLNWSDSMYSSYSVARKGEVNTETGLCRLVVNKQVATAEEWRAPAGEEAKEEMKTLQEWRPELMFDILVDDLTPEKKKFKGFYRSSTYQEEEVDTVREFPERAFIYDKKNDTYYRLAGSSKYDGIIILFGQYGFFLSCRDGEGDGVDMAGYNSYIGCAELDDILQGREKELQDAVDIFCWSKEPAAEIIDEAKTAIYDRINDDLDDPFIDPETDLVDEALSFTCGSKEGLTELCVMILQATIPAKFWDTVGDDVTLYIHASCEDEEANLYLDSYEEPELCHFIDKNDSVCTLLEEALTQNEPQGYTWEYNDQARDRRSGYDRTREVVTVEIPRPSSTHLKVAQMYKLTEWCNKYGYDVPEEKSLVFEIHAH